MTPSPRSLCPCQSTRISVPLGRTTSSKTKRMRRRTPHGVACPTVSHTTTALAPQRIASENTFRTTSGRERVVSSVTNITGSTFVNRKTNRLLAMPQESHPDPNLGILADGAGADERGDLDGVTHPLGNLHDGANVRDYGTGGAIGMNSHALFADLPRQPQGMGGHMGAGTRQTNVGHLDAQRFHESKNVQLLGNRRVSDRWGLQTIPQGFIGERNRAMSHSTGVSEFQS